MEIKCNVIQDLLPLYVDNACSKESADMVKEHISTCPECKKLYDEMCSQNEENILKSECMDIIAHHKISVNKKKKLIISLICAATIIISIFATALTVLGVCFVIDRVQLKPLEINYGESKLYTKEEMDEAIEFIKDSYEYDFFDLPREKLLAVNYTDDYICKKTLLHKNASQPKNNKFTNCMIFTIDFKTSILGQHAIWLPNEYYCDYYLVLMKTQDGEWIEYSSSFIAP